MGSRAPTSHDVARLARVSQPTVSRALRDDPRVSAATRRAVHDAAEQLGYVPSTRGRSLSTRATGQVGVVVADLGNPFYLQVLDAAHACLAEAGRSMVVLTADGDSEALLARLLNGSIDGVLLTTTLLTSPVPAALTRREFPFVMLNRAVDEPLGDACVADNVAGGRLAADALVELGHRTIAALTGPADTSTGRDRDRGFRDQLAVHGLALPETLAPRGPFSFAFGHAAVGALVEAGATAVFCANDVVALGALNALRGRGVRVPDDVSVIGFDDIALAAWEVFELTTIRQDIDRMVRLATQLVLERIETGAPPRRIMLEPELVPRATHGPPRTA